MDRVTILDGPAVVATHVRSLDRGQQIENQQHVVELERQKRKARTARGRDRLTRAVSNAARLLAAAGLPGRVVARLARARRRRFDVFTVISGPVQERSGVALFCLDGRRCRTKRSLFEEWSTALEFPAYFGHNWDAFNDCFRDLVDRSAPVSPVVLRIDHAAAVLADADPDLVILIDV